MFLAERAEDRRGLTAELFGSWASARKRASGRRRLRTRQLAERPDTRRAHVLARVNRRARRQQGHGVGVRRVREQRRQIRYFDDLAEIHDSHVVAHVSDDAEVVADEDVGQAAFALQPLQKIEDLRLDCDVERRYRLVADNEVRIGGERARDANSLALAA